MLQEEEKKATGQGASEQNDRKKQLLKSKKLWLVLAVLLTVACVISFSISNILEIADAAKTTQKGIKYYEQGQYEKAVKCFVKGAEQGDDIAQNELGMCYLQGEGVPKDPEKAVKWFGMSAAQGNVISQFNLGTCYERGKGVPKDKEKALDWFRKAAERGHADSQYKLGWSYERGEGVPQDDAEAIHWYEKAEKQGHKLAHNALQKLKFKR